MEEDSHEGDRRKSGRPELDALENYEQMLR
jgi:hypothetical protein